MNQPVSAPEVGHAWSLATPGLNLRGIGFGMLMSLCSTGDPFGKFAVSDIVGLDDRTDYQDQKLTLVVSVLGEEGDKMQPERIQKSV